jgi:hypothetical protein
VTPPSVRGEQEKNQTKIHSLSAQQIALPSTQRRKEKKRPKIHHSFGQLFDNIFGIGDKFSARKTTPSSSKEPKKKNSRLDDPLAQLDNMLLGYQEDTTPSEKIERKVASYGRFLKRKSDSDADGKLKSYREYLEEGYGKKGKRPRR